MTINPSQLAENSHAIRAPYLAGFTGAISPAAALGKTSQQPINWTKQLDIPSDILVEVGGVAFALHRFPLTSRCGLLKMLIVEERDRETSCKVELEGIPGGAEGFELAAKFCYGASLEISKHNVALLRCVSEFLDMSEEHGENNLVTQTEAYLERLGKQSFKDIVATLQSCQNFLPMAEDLKIVGRCIEWAAMKSILEQDLNAEPNHHGLVASSFHDHHHGPNNQVPSWVEDLANLGISFYQRVLAAMRERGLRPESVGSALVYYAQKSLKGMPKKNSGQWYASITGNKCKAFDMTTAIEHEQRILVETIVSLLPKEKHVASIKFLIGLLRTACVLETTLACRLELEQRIGSQLHKATLDDLLIPSFGNYDGETLFDVDIVHRLVVSFLEQQADEEDSNDDRSEVYDEADGFNSPTQNPMLKVGKLLDGYLAEVAADANLRLSKFVTLAELLPDYARPVEDGLYRAIDIYLKAHSSLTDVERKKICRLLDFQRLSQEACTHAAQNERLPVQVVVQVLYFEQLRIRNVMAGGYHPENGPENSISNLSHNANINGAGGVLVPPLQAGSIHKISNGPLCASLSPKDHYASVRRENRELKLEVARMRMRLSDLEKDHMHMKQDMERSNYPPRQSGNAHHGFFHALSKSISKLNPFHHHKLNPLHQYGTGQQHINCHKSHSQPEPRKRANSMSSASASSQASSFEQPKRDPRNKRHSLS